MKKAQWHQTLSFLVILPWMGESDQDSTYTTGCLFCVTYAALLQGKYGGGEFTVVFSFGFEIIVRTQDASKSARMEFSMGSITMFAALKKHNIPKENL